MNPQSSVSKSHAIYVQSSTLALPLPCLKLNIIMACLQILDDSDKNT